LPSHGTSARAAIQLGQFPPGWAEWNDRFRDTVRALWRGDGGQLAEFATRFTGSADLFEHHGRRPSASINLVTAHDGFTLHDLVSYNDRHNEANGEDNRDGHSHNLSSNHGVEGDTDDAAILVACAADAQPAGHAAARAGHADAAGRR
jgi:glycogen operon protein